MNEGMAGGDSFLADIRLRGDRGAPREVVLGVVDLAIEIAREGREGHRIGTMFVLGDERAVLDRSRCLILDPLAGHPPSARRLLDPNLRETVKELALLDGGFIVSADGHVVSATRYFDASLAEVDARLGLGSRHIAAASISRQTTALAIVVSESSVVRLFEAGQLIAEILPELWLLNRISSHVQHARTSAHPAENIAVLTSEPSGGA